MALFSAEKFKSVKRYDVIQESGDIIFAPSLWHHQVHNLEDTLSINHNWFNAANAAAVRAEMARALTDVEAELEDCRSTSSPQEWNDTCQRVLRANHGMHFMDFDCVLKAVINARKERLTKGHGALGLEETKVGDVHAECDLHIGETLLALAKR